MLSCIQQTVVFMAEAPDNLPTTDSSRSSSSFGAGGSSTTQTPISTSVYYAPTKPPATVERGASRSRIQQLLSMGIVLVALFVIAGVFGGSAAWLWGRFTADSSSLVIQTENPILSDTQTALAPEWETGDQPTIPGSVPVSAPVEGTRPVVTAQAQPLMSEYADEPQLTTRYAFATLRNQRSLTLPQFLSPFLASQAPCFAQLTPCVPTYYNRDGGSFQVGKSVPVNWQATAGESGDPASFFSYAYGWVPMRLNAMLEYYHVPLQEERQNPFTTLVMSAYQDSLQAEVSPVVTALWLEHVYRSAQQYGFTLDGAEHKASIDTAQFASDWRYATARLSQPRRLWQRLTEPAVLYKLRASSLSPEAKGIIYASYQQLHPELVERMFTQAGWLERSYTSAMQFAQHPQLTDQTRFAHQFTDEDWRADEFFPQYAQDHAVTPWVSCTGLVSVACLPSGGVAGSIPTGSLLAENADSVDSNASPSAASAASFPVDQESSTSVEFATDWNCRAVHVFTPWCSEQILMNW